MYVLRERERETETDIQDDMKICVLLNVVSSCKVYVISVANDHWLILSQSCKLSVVFFTVIVGVVCGVGFCH